VEKENQTITKLLLVQETMREPFYFTCHGEERRFVGEEEDRRSEKEERRESKHQFKT
jgi:hypothetical protein